MGHSVDRLGSSVVPIHLPDGLGMLLCCRRRRHCMGTSWHRSAALTSLLLAAVLLSVIPEAGSLEMQEHVIPSHLVLGQTADLICRFRLQKDRNETLYSVKWYKDNDEFYNFIASPKIAKRMYPVPGITVDMARSSPERVRLLDVSLATSGKYGCEVSVDAPTFTTVIAKGHMLVVALPEGPPEIDGGRDLYRLGDELSVNCTARRSKPAALLNWHVNGQQAPYHSLVQRPVLTAADGRETRQLGLRLVLKPAHFSDGRLTLTCLAAIASVYGQQAEITVQQPASRPQPPAKTLEIKEQNNGGQKTSSAWCAQHVAAVLLLSLAQMTWR